MADYSIEVSIPNQGPKGDNGGIPEAPEDGLHYARKDAGWAETIGLEADGSIAAVVQVRQGTAAELGEIVLNDGEIAVELEGGAPKQIRVGDGTTSGGLTPQINDWNFVYGAAGGNQDVTNSSTLVNIGFFQNAFTLEANSVYQIIGRAYFTSVGEGGTTINVGNEVFASLVAIQTADWSPFGVLTFQGYESESEDAGIFEFQGFHKTGASQLSPLLLFAQRVATAGSTTSFKAENSYIAYRKIA
jgi:hypothetical protein